MVYWVCLLPSEFQWRMEKQKQKKSGSGNTTHTHWVQVHCNLLDSAYSLSFCLQCCWKTYRNYVCVFQRQIVAGIEFSKLAQDDMDFNTFNKSLQVRYSMNKSPGLGNLVMWKFIFQLAGLGFKPTQKPWAGNFAVELVNFQTCPSARCVRILDA